MTLLDQEQAERFDERRFADTGHAGNAEAERLPGVGQQRREELVGLRAMVGAGGFEKGDGLGDGSALGKRRFGDDLLQQLNPPFCASCSDPFGLRCANPFGLSLSKAGHGFDKLSPNGINGVNGINGINGFIPVNGRPGPRQLLNSLPVPANQRLLLRARPTLDLLLERNCALTRLKFTLP